ncbi:MAG TPA: hypothetical protein VLH85_00330 [Levilinea sp.]|nr:hypothetical protein [Levilinea sp.]
MLDFTILGGKHRKNTIDYLKQEHLPVDEGGRSRYYDIVITCTDLVIQQNITGKKMILVQEGMMEPEGLTYHLVRTFNLPRYLANTAATGLSDAYDLFCVASPGYRSLFIQKGVKPEKITVTGIPNFDHFSKYKENDFPYRHYVLAATSNSREVFKPDNREEFIRKVAGIAAGRQIIFKLHPNENEMRARAEIERFARGALIYEEGNIHHMVANCDVLVTQTSSVTFIGLAMNKEVHSDLNLSQLRYLMPIQNEGTSAYHIADLCRQLACQPRSSVQPRNQQPHPSFSLKKIVDSIQ